MNPPRLMPTMVLLLLLLTATRPAAAQGLRLDAELGVTRSTFGGEGTRGLDEHRTGWLTGLGLGYGFGGVTEIESGARGSLQGFEEPITADVRLSYLHLPVVVRVTPLRGRTVRPSLSGGPTVSFEVRCRTVLDESVLALLLECDDDARPSADVGLRAGAGVAWSAAGMTMLVEGRYELGLRDLDSVERLGVRHRGGSLVSRLSIPLNRSPTDRDRHR